MNNQITNICGNDTFKNFLDTKFGKNILHCEKVFYHNITKTIFGYYAIQLGLPQINFLQSNKIRNKYILPQDVSCDFKHLPFDTESIDLIICPHTLESNNDYEILLKECYRVLMPKGKLIITNFNKLSWLGLYDLTKTLLFQSDTSITNQINWIELDTLKNSLINLNFVLKGGKFFNYLPPLNNDSLLSNLSFLNKVGDRWFPTLSNIYTIVASKEVLPLTPINPQKNNIKPQYVTGVSGV